LHLRLMQYKVSLKDHIRYVFFSKKIKLEISFKSNIKSHQQKETGDTFYLSNK
jgi:hypothetical protein